MLGHMKTSLPVTHSESVLNLKLRPKMMSEFFVAVTINSGNIYIYKKKRVLQYFE